MTWTRTWVVTLLVASLAVLACGKKGGGAGGKPKIVVSIFPIYDLTKRIAGDRAEVHLVLPVGKSEHAYEATPKEIAKLEGANLGIAVGLDMDVWVESLMKSAGGAKFIRIGDKVPTIPIDVEPITEEEAAEHGHDDHDHDDHDHDKPGSAAPAKPADDHDHAAIGSPDPHVWMDPDRMLAVVDRITEELTTLDPKSKDVFAKNAEAVKTALRDTDTKIAARSKAWTKRTIVTFHGSMQYFAKRYNIRIAAVVEPLAGKEPTPAYIAQVLAAIKRGQASALFTEPQLDRAPGQMIAREAGIPLGELDPIGGVAGRDSYEALLTWNTDQLEKVLK
ncbi:MAG TPA: metal ABC transporter substrate-binding protein [Kofleriaceae bacterium]